MAETAPLASTLSGYKRTEFEYPELRDLDTFSAAWYRRWRELHLARYPGLDVSSRSNLAMFVEMAERREATGRTAPTGASGDGRDR